MSFENWRRRSKLCECVKNGDWQMERALKAAYKAGERQGHKDAEESAARECNEVKNTKLVAMG